MQSTPCNKALTCTKGHSAWACLAKKKTGSARGLGASGGSFHHNSTCDFMVIRSLTLKNHQPENHELMNDTTCDLIVEKT